MTIGAFYLTATTRTVATRTIAAATAATRTAAATDSPGHMDQAIASSSATAVATSASFGPDLQHPLRPLAQASQPISRDLPLSSCLRFPG